MLRIEFLIDARAELGEGPLWDVAEQRLYWIDSLGAKVHSCDASGGDARAWSVPEHVGSLALRERGGAIVSLRDGFYTLDFATGACRKLADPDPGKPRIRMNDGKVDRQGRFIAGYMDYEERDPICALFSSTPAVLSRSSTTASSAPMVRAGVPMAGRSISPIPASAKSGPTTTIRRAARRQTAVSSRPFHLRASRACRTERPSMPKASSGACPSMKGSSCASRPAGSWIVSSACLSKARQALASADPTSTSPSSPRWRGQ